MIFFLPFKLPLLLEVDSIGCKDTRGYSASSCVRHRLCSLDLALCVMQALKLLLQATGVSPDAFKPQQAQQKVSSSIASTCETKYSITPIQSLEGNVGRALRAAVSVMLVELFGQP